MDVSDASVEEMAGWVGHLLARTVDAFLLLKLHEAVDKPVPKVEDTESQRESHTSYSGRWQNEKKRHKYFKSIVREVLGKGTNETYNRNN